MNMGGFPRDYGTCNLYLLDRLPWQLSMKYCTFIFFYKQPVNKQQGLKSDVGYATEGSNVSIPKQPNYFFIIVIYPIINLLLAIFTYP